MSYDSWKLATPPEYAESTERAPGCLCTDSESCDECMDEVASDLMHRTDGPVNRFIVIQRAKRLMKVRDPLVVIDALADCLERLGDEEIPSNEERS